MIIRCPSCGAEASLDVLLNNEDAARVMAQAFTLGAAGNAAMRYLALFRPDKRRLSFSRVAALLDDLVPAIRAQRIERDGRVHDAPLAAWVAGLEKTLQARDAGTLRTPLKTHGYLFEIVIAEAARAVAVRDGTPPHTGEGMKSSSAVARAVDTLNQRKRGNDADS